MCNVFDLLNAASYTVDRYRYNYPSIQFTDQDHQFKIAARRMNAIVSIATRAQGAHTCIVTHLTRTYAADARRALKVETRV